MGHTVITEKRRDTHFALIREKNLESFVFIFHVPPLYFPRHTLGAIRALKSGIRSSGLQSTARFYADAARIVRRLIETLLVWTSPTNDKGITGHVIGL